MKLRHLFDTVKEDILAVADAQGVPRSALVEPSGNTGVKNFYPLLSKISFDRAYDDTHPSFASGRVQRILPHDGRDYCFFYFDAEGNESCNDSHVLTLLRAIQKSLQ